MPHQNLIWSSSNVNTPPPGNLLFLKALAG